MFIVYATTNAYAIATASPHMPTYINYSIAANAERLRLPLTLPNAICQPENIYVRSGTRQAMPQKICV